MKNARNTLLATLALAATLGLLNSCNNADADAAARARLAQSTTVRAPSGPRLASGSTMLVTIGGEITSKTAHAGDTWYGTVAEDITGSNGGVIRAGSAVTGVVTSALAAKKGSRAMLDLAVRGIQVNGRNEAVTANALEVVAGSTRARNLGVVAGGAAAGAVVGNNVGDHNHTVLGAVVGGLTAAGIVAKTEGYQVVLKSGTVMSFSVTESVTMR